MILTPSQRNSLEKAQNLFPVKTMIITICLLRTVAARRFGLPDFCLSLSLSFRGYFPHTLPCRSGPPSHPISSSQLIPSLLPPSLPSPTTRFASLGWPRPFFFFLSLIHSSLPLSSFTCLITCLIWVVLSEFSLFWGTSALWNSRGWTMILQTVVVSFLF